MHAPSGNSGQAVSADTFSILPLPAIENLFYKTTTMLVLRGHSGLSLSVSTGTCAIKREAQATAEVPVLKGRRS